MWWLFLLNQSIAVLSKHKQGRREIFERSRSSGLQGHSVSVQGRFHYKFGIRFSVLREVCVSMVDGHSGHGGGGVPLYEFRRDIPPGWAPGLPDYPLRMFFERLKLWYRIFEGDDAMVGPLVAGRLQGKAQRLDLQRRLPRPDGGADVGSEALVSLSVEEARDPSNPSLIIRHAVPLQYPARDLRRI